MGTVYEAVALRLDTTVAIKQTHFTDERLMKQFEREARLLARLRHPAMPRVIDHFEEDNGLFLVMDYIEGDDLMEMQQKQNGPFSVEDVLKWADQLLDALDYLHSQDPQVIHRDIKPQNLKLTSHNQIILLDFGLAKGFAGQISRVTTSGSIFGYTPNYAPLEQIQGTGTGPYSDVYSLSATLYHLVTGRVPPDVLSRLTAITEGQPDPLRPANEVNTKVSVPLARVLSRGMEIARPQRFSTAAEMRRALHDANQPQAHPTSELMETMLPPTVVSPVTVAASGSSHHPPALQSTVASPLVNQPKKEKQPSAPKQEEVWDRLEKKMRGASAPTQATGPKNSKKPFLWFALVAGALLISAVLLFRTSGETDSNKSVPLNQASSNQAGTLSGRITDQKGKGVPGAFVAIAMKEGRLRQTATTGADGSYLFQALQPAEYTIEASLPSRNVWLPGQTVRTTAGTTTFNITMRLPN